VRSFLAATEADRLGAVFRLALSTGLRRGELIGLTWEEVNLEQLVLTVRRQVLVRPRSAWDVQRVYVRETTKTRKVPQGPVR
jgi:integrase